MFSYKDHATRLKQLERIKFRCAWRPHRSTDEDRPLRSTQLCCRWAVNVKCATCATIRNDELSAMSFRRQLKTELYIRAYYSH